MRPSPWSIGFIMIVLGGASLLFANAHGVRPTVPAGVIAAVLALGGFWLMLRRPGAFWVAIAAGGLTAASGVVGFLLKREVGLPLPPIISLVAGLYICLRVLLARSGLRPEADADPKVD